MVALRKAVAANAGVNLNGKIALVCGGTAGIGKAMALRLARAHASVIIAGRSESAGAEVVAEMKTLSPESGHGFVRLDASLLKNVNSFAENFKKEHSKLHYLVATCGIASVAGRTETVEGIDQKLALHYYSRMRLIHDLLPLLKSTAASGDDVRVMSVLSGGVHAPYFNVEDLDLKTHFSLSNAANAAGFYNDLGLDALAQANPEIAFVHAAPGAVSTSWGTELPTLMRGTIRVLQRCFFKSAGDCAEQMCVGLFADDWKAGSEGGAQVKLMSATSQHVPLLPAHTPETREKLWAHTMDMITKPLETK